MSDYKILNLNRDKLDENIKNFLTSTQSSLDEEKSVTERSRRRISFGRAGSIFALVDLHLNQDGTTTIQWKLGKNHDLGKTLADYLKATIDPAELKSVNYSLQGITRENFNTILELLIETNELEIDETDHNSSKITKLTSKRHQDKLTLSHHTSNILQIQGRPLSCYRHVIYFLTDLLDLKGLEQVLYRKDDSCAEIVREEMAIDYLNQYFPKNYSRLPNSIQKLLISGCCIKLASPTLTDYSLLLYPDLRSLEGVLKQNLASYGLVYSEAQCGFGDFFQKNGSSYTLKKDFENHIAKENIRESFCKAYAFYNKNRHTLFHMEDFPDASRMTSQLQNAINLSKEIYKLIDDIYTAIYPS